MWDWLAHDWLKKGKSHARLLIKYFTMKELDSIQFCWPNTFPYKYPRYSYTKDTKTLQEYSHEKTSKFLKVGKTWNFPGQPSTIFTDAAPCRGKVLSLTFGLISLKDKIPFLINLCTSAYKAKQFSMLCPSDP